MAFDKRVFAENLKRLRREKSARENRDVTQAEVAEAVGVNEATVQNYEAGRSVASYEVAWALADFYGVALDELGGRKRGSAA